MSTLPQKLSALLLGAAITAAVAGPQEECMDRAAKKFQPEASYLTHKPGMMGSTAFAFSMASSLKLPSVAAGKLMPIFTKSATGIVIFGSEMSNLYFYDVPVSAITKPGERVTPDNIDEIGLLASAHLHNGEHIRPDEARNIKITPEFLTFIQTVRSCI